MVVHASEERFGEMLLAEGLVTPAQLESALVAQAQELHYVPLGHILVERGIITRKQLNYLLDRHKKPRLGELLVRSGAISPEQLHNALQQQPALKRPLGEVLIKLGYLTDEAMRQALGMQLNIPYLDLDRVELERNLARIINPNYARRHFVVPVSCTRQTLTVSMADPTARTVIDELASFTGLSINVVTSSLESIKRAFKRLYDETVDIEPTLSATAVPGAEAIDLGVADGEAGKSRYLDEFQDKRADAAVRQLLALALERRASDIHLETLATRVQVRFRVDGVLHELDVEGLQEILRQRGQGDCLAHQGAGEAGHRRAPAAAGRGLPGEDRARRPGQPGGLPHLDHPRLLRRERRPPHPRLAPRAAPD